MGDPGKEAFLRFMEFAYEAWTGGGAHTWCGEAKHAGKPAGFGVILTFNPTAFKRATEAAMTVDPEDIAWSVTHLPPDPRSN